MSKKSISHILRTALWEAYDFRCFYCRELVAYDALEIDHLLPRSLGDVIDADVQLSRYGLPAHWDLHAPTNLVPSCRPCNLRKSTLLANQNQMMMLLTEAHAKVARVEALYEQIEKRVKRANLVAQLSIGLEIQTLTKEDVAAILRESDHGFNRLATQPVQSAFINVSLAELTPDSVALLYDKTVRLGGNTFTGLTLTDPNNENHTIEVQTIREYREAVDAGCFAMTTFDMKMEAFFRLAEGILTALSASRPYRLTYIESPHTGIVDLASMPSSLLPYIGDNDARHAKLVADHPTFAQMAAAEELEIRFCSSTNLEVKYQGFISSFQEVLRSDLDGDSIEDLLVFIYVRADGGTMGFGMPPIALARKSFDGLFEVTQMIPSPVNAAI